MLTVLALIAAVGGIVVLNWLAPLSARRRERELAALNLIVTGDAAAQMVRDGWRACRVNFGQTEIWLTDGPPALDTKRRIFANGKKLRLGLREPALTLLGVPVDTFVFRT